MSPSGIESVTHVTLPSRNGVPSSATRTAPSRQQARLTFLSTLTDIEHVPITSSGLLEDLDLPQRVGSQRTNGVVGMIEHLPSPRTENIVVAVRPRLRRQSVRRQ